jgi:hypothetical protein
MRPAFSYAGGSTACEPVIFICERTWLAEYVELCKSFMKEDSAGEQRRGTAKEDNAGEQQKSTWRTAENSRRTPHVK